MSASTFSCDSEIRISYPFAQDESMWALFASHDCEDYALMMTVVLSQEVLNKFIGFYGASLSDQGCSMASEFNGSMACEFELSEPSKGFAILFSGGFSPVFYLTDWQKE
mmetsp:Transcript_7079/g.9862  ORF Transcript_7079/g.9862 Transcript_7079/m.9862 type:complete len:109 (-) Transcript_7079:132-458(-)